MKWLDKIVEKWYWLKDKIRPVWNVIKKIFSVIGTIFRVIWKTIYGLRGILISAPVAAAALVVAAWGREKLPEVVEITGDDFFALANFRLLFLGNIAF